jgi:hypothetical protein
MKSQATSYVWGEYVATRPCDQCGIRSFLMMEAGQPHGVRSMDATPYSCSHLILIICTLDHPHKANHDVAPLYMAAEPRVRCLQAPSRQLKLGNHMIFLGRMYGTHHVLAI